MNDEEFIVRICKLLGEFKHNRLKGNEEARVALSFMTQCKNKLLQYINEHGDDEIIEFKRCYVTQAPCDFEIRICIDDEFINELAGKGYAYKPEMSSSEKIVLHKI